MATTYKKLGEANPSATSLTVVYTTPTGGRAVVSTIIVCNRSATPTSFRLSHASGGAADDLAQYFAYDCELLANEVWSFTTGITMDSDDELRIYALDATVSVGVWGEEVS